MKLEEYRKKRDRNRTPEPFGAEPSPGEKATTGAFVVHLHDASRRHYDLRVEMAGVLLSFAVPRGPSLNPKEKHLAVQTEDHPIEYLDFEAVIPPGNYGAGPMIVWDRGLVQYLNGAPEEGLVQGKIDMILTGYKLRGRFALVRTKRAQGNSARGQAEWLFFKKQDAHASVERCITEAEPRSILSGLTVEELRDREPIARAIEKLASEIGRRSPDKAWAEMVPMLCTHEKTLPEGPDFLFELKLDGVRTIAAKSGEEVRLNGRSLRETTDTYPEVARALRALPATQVVLDGEIVAFDDSGRPNFQRLGSRIHARSMADVRHAAVRIPVTYLVFDVLSVDDYSLLDVPLVRRKEILHRLLPGRGVIRALDHLEGQGGALLAFCRGHHLEGVVAKKATSLYVPGPKRTPLWVKVKCEREADFVVVGITEGEGGRSGLGALDVASYAAGVLAYRGKVGSGLTDEAIAQLLCLLRPLACEEAAAQGHYSTAPRGRTHVHPRVVVSVQFLGFSDDGLLRHPVFRGIRDDIAPEDCIAAPLETPVETAPSAEHSVAVAEHKVAITNPKKVLWPNEGITKADLVRYYEAVAEPMLRYLRGRPMMLVRYPDGIDGKSFYQWNAPLGTPSWIKTESFKPDGNKDPVRLFRVDSQDALTHVANLAAVSIHILASTFAAAHAADFLTIDLDVKQSSLERAIPIALFIRELVEEIGLCPFVKTSGQSGLHVLVALGGLVTETQARALADFLGRIVVQRFPETATMERTISKRGERVFIDTGQTGPGRTIVAPFSVRAVPGARVSTPLQWQEVTPALDPALFTIRSVPDRIRSEGDAMAEVLAKVSEFAIGTAIDRLGKRIGVK